MVRLFYPNDSEIATKYEYKGRHGGRHKGAAGFQCAKLPFKKI